MKKILIITVLSLLIYGCGSFPTASEYWTYQGKPVVSKIAVDEMLNCGFENAWNPIRMPKHARLKAHLCMEKKGYLFDNEPICKWGVYDEFPECKGK